MEIYHFKTNNMEDKLKNFLLETKLNEIIEFQEKYPKSHVGGSFGLFLLGYDLQRDISQSDLDFICPEFNEATYLNGNKSTEKTSDSNDFEFKYIRNYGEYCIKHEISINSDQEFQVIELNGKKYNVSLFGNIMKFKKKYADKGYFKHKADIIAIETGVRPILDDNDLPFYGLQTVLNKS